MINDAKSIEIKKILTIEKKESNVTGFINTFGDALERDDSEIADISSIILSNQLGKYNSLVQEGKSSCRK